MLLLLLTFALAVAAGCVASSPHAKEAKTPPAGEIRGAWVWSTDVANEGAETVAKRLAQSRINQVFLLVKGYSGKVCYPSQLTPNLYPGKDTLREMLDACHQRGIKVHAWFVFNADSHWGQAHPDDAMYHVGKAEAWDQGPYSKKDDPEKIPICPLSRAYRSHLTGLIQEVLDRYDVDGIHLDYIRYGHMAYCFCPRHRELATRNGISIEKLRQAIYETCFAPRKQNEHYIKLYREGDPDIVCWVGLRQEEINLAIQEIRHLVKRKNAALPLSAAFMPEGGEADDAFALCHYGQNYTTAGALVDFILPMTYSKTAVGIARVALNAEKKSGRPAYGGLWACEEDRDAGVSRSDESEGRGVSGKLPVLGLREKVETLRSRGVKGFVLFRYGPKADQLWKDLP